MTSTTVSHQLDQERPLLSRSGWVWAALITAGAIGLFNNFIWHMGSVALSQWGGDWSHALVIPFISLYYVFLKRETLLATPRRVFWPGLPVFFLGIFSYAWWIAPGRNDMLQGYSMIVAIFGLVLFIFGPAMMRTLWFPVVFLVFAVKVSDRIWDDIAIKLQYLAAGSATKSLNFLGIDATVEGSTIMLFKGVNFLGKLNVAEACAGLRMLMAFLALGVAMAFLFERAWWQRVIMVAMTVPIAVGVNVARVTVMGVLYLVNKEMSAGDFHKFVGMLMLIPALLLYMGLGWVLDQIIIEDDRKPTTSSQARPAVSPAPTLRWPLLAQGIVGGIVLVVLVGADYALVWATLKRGVFGAWLTPPRATWLLIMGVLSVGGWGIYLRGLGRSRGRQKSGGATVALAPAIALGIVLAAAGGLYGILAANHIVPIKKSIQLREPLYHIPDRLGDWKKISDDPPMSAEMIEALGTTQYISRVYVNTPAPGEAATSVRLHVAYYTGTPDTVPHVPERCYTAGGADALYKSTTTVTLDGPLYENGPDGPVAFHGSHADRVHIPETSFSATIFTFGSSSRQSNVIYFFAANGKYLSSPDLVRLHGFDPRDVYSYYCKIEVNFPEIADTTVATQRTSEFLSAAVPEIMACLPDWVDVQQGKYPLKNGQDK